VSVFRYDLEIFSGPTELQAHQPDLAYLFWYLTKEGILPLGIIQVNRIPNCKLPQESVLKRRGRGAFVENVVDRIDVIIVGWC
jgi:hypothetical protein